MFVIVRIASSNVIRIFQKYEIERLFDWEKRDKVIFRRRYKKPWCCRRKK